jgi:hypothetical protein
MASTFDSSINFDRNMEANVEPVNMESISGLMSDQMISSEVIQKLRLGWKC